MHILWFMLIQDFCDMFIFQMPSTSSGSLGGPSGSEHGKLLLQSSYYTKPNFPGKTHNLISTGVVTR